MLLAAILVSTQLAVTPTFTAAESNLVEQYVAAAREANQSPRTLEAQLSAARLGYLVTRLAAPWRKEEIAYSVLRFGRRIVDLSPEKAEGYLWVAVGVGELALLYGISGQSAIVEEYHRNMEQSLSLDSRLLGGTMIAHLGMMHTVSPQAGAVWKRAAARQIFGEAIGSFDNPLLRYYAGQLALIEGDHKLAATLLKPAALTGRASSFERALAVVLLREGVGTSELAAVR